jgi:hypothetical protein
MPAVNLALKSSTMGVTQSTTTWQPCLARAANAREALAPRDDDGKQTLDLRQLLSYPPGIIKIWLSELLWPGPLG